MAITIQEREAGRSDTGNTIVRSYTLRTTAGEDEVAVKAALMSAVPATIGTKVLQIAESTVEEQASSVWYGTAVYAPPQFLAREEDTSTLTFEVTGTTQRITQSRATINTYVAPSFTTAVDYKGAINVDGDGIPQGVDILVPTIGYTVNHTFPATKLPGAYAVTLANTVGRVNNATFQGIARRGALLERVVGTRRTDQRWDLSFTFAVSKNETSLTIGSITGIAKAGWDYLWVTYWDRVINGVRVREPVQVNVEQVYEEADFSLLDIGT